MSDKKSDPWAGKEARILRVMKRVLTDVVKDTATQPGMKHPLSDQTIENIRHCLHLISERERELTEASGKSMTMRPRYVDEPEKTTVVPIEKIGRRDKPDKG
jgi:hypothetical protein